MIKKTIKFLLAIIFLIIKKIFIRKNSVPHKIMDNLSNKLHTVFLFTSFCSIYLLWFDIVTLNTPIYILLFLQFVLIIRYFNPLMLEEKTFQIKILKVLNKFGIILFILNWIFLSFGFAFLFTIVLLVNNGFYIFIIAQVNKQKEQEEFKKQFGEDANYSKDSITQTHIVNLFEKDIDINQISKSDIKKQYRTMAKKYHPDVYKGDEQSKFSSINLSYKYLIDLIK
ncbi:MAG: DnaJ domain-containing protein [Campylobacterota bacterium]|nr:DnaJ domain-containing protein [Campylobacterota bacterium]